MYKLLQAIVVIFGLLFYIGLQLDSFKITPDNAIIFIDHSKKLYFSPLCVYQKLPSTNEQLLDLEFPKFFYLESGKYRDIKNKGFNTPGNCKGTKYWFQENRSMSGELLQNLGILKPLPARWNPDGSWNY